jgi:tripartite ATP-independent transporter DctM subunit
MTMSLLLLAFTVFLLAIGFPVGFALAGATLAAVGLGSDFPMVVVLKEMFVGIDSFALLAVPFFILAAELMSGGSLTEVLLRFASQFVGHLRGGLGHANVLSLTMFSGISGSALADAAGPGAMLVRMMERAGYDRGYAAALTASTAIIGPIIPPSIIMIIYALQDDTVTPLGLFMAGIVPGVAIAAAMMITNQVICLRRGFKSDVPRPNLREMIVNSVKAVPALLLPVIILGGMRGGVFTPTEASVVAVVYALLVGKYVYRTLQWKMVPVLLSRTAILTSSVLIIVAASNAFAWVLTTENVPQAISGWIAQLGLGPIALLLLVNVFLLVFGIFIEPLPGVMVLVPILAPVAHAAGIDPIHFAMIVIYNLTLGMITPPVGGLLFVTSAVTRVPLAQLSRELNPFMLAHLVVLLLITLVPAISTWLPAISGLAVR